MGKKRRCLNRQGNDVTTVPCACVNMKKQTSKDVPIKKKHPVYSSKKRHSKKFKEKQRKGEEEGSVKICVTDAKHEGDINHLDKNFGNALSMTSSGSDSNAEKSSLVPFETEGELGLSDTLTPEKWEMLLGAEWLEEESTNPSEGEQAEKEPFGEYGLLPSEPSASTQSSEKVLDEPGLISSAVMSPEESKTYSQPQPSMQLCDVASELVEPRPNENHFPVHYKTEMCWSYQYGVYCVYGRGCFFAHGFQELRSEQRHPKYKTTFCRNFQSYGQCRYGRRCTFIHSGDFQSLSRVQPCQSDNFNNHPNDGNTMVEHVHQPLQHSEVIVQHPSRALPERSPDDLYYQNNQLQQHDPVPCQQMNLPLGNSGMSIHGQGMVLGYYFPAPRSVAPVWQQQLYFYHQLQQPQQLCNQSQQQLCFCQQNQNYIQYQHFQHQPDQHQQQQDQQQLVSGNYPPSNASHGHSSAQYSESLAAPMPLAPVVYYGAPNNFLHFYPTQFQPHTFQASQTLVQQQERFHSVHNDLNGNAVSFSPSEHSDTAMDHTIRTGPMQNSKRAVSIYSPSRRGQQ